MTVTSASFAAVRYAACAAVIAAVLVGSVAAFAYVGQYTSDADIDRRQLEINSELAGGSDYRKYDEATRENWQRRLPENLPIGTQGR